LYYNHICNFSVEELGKADFVGVSIINRNKEFCIASTVTTPRLQQKLYIFKTSISILNVKMPWSLVNYHVQIVSSLRYYVGTTDGRTL